MLSSFLIPSHPQPHLLNTIQFICILLKALADCLILPTKQAGRPKLPLKEGQTQSSDIGEKILTSKHQHVELCG